MRNRLGAVLFATLPLVLSTTSAAAVDLSLGDAGLTLSALPAHGRAALLAVERHRVLGAATRVSRLQTVVEDDDGDGTIEVAFDAPLAATSLWVAIDLADGSAAVAAPEGSPLRAFAADAPRLRRSLGRLDVERSDLEVMVVRPGVGAWALSLADGGPDDDDAAADGRLTAALDLLVPLADSPPAPLSFESGDVVAAIDPRSLSVFAVRVAD